MCDWIRGQQVWVRRRRRNNTREVEGGSAQRCVQQRMNRDAWMKESFFGAQFEPVYTCHLCCSVEDCTCENVARQLYLSTPPVDCQGIHFTKSEREITAVQSRMRIAKKSNFCSTSNLQYRSDLPTQIRFSEYGYVLFDDVTWN